MKENIVLPEGKTPIGTLTRRAFLAMSLAVGANFSGSFRHVTSQSESIVAWVLGYGSLINSASRRRTTGMDSNVHADVRRVQIRGMQTEWGAKSASGYTALSLTTKDGISCPGVLFGVTRRQLDLLDLRERVNIDHPEGAGDKEPYYRLRLSPKDIFSYPFDAAKHPSPLTLPSSVPSWVYFGGKPDDPTDDYPIIQSYIDVVLAGCIEEGGKDFAKLFIKTVANWNWPWLDDRKSPRPKSAIDEIEKAQSYADAIDQMLSDLVPEAFKRRRPA